MKKCDFGLSENEKLIIVNMLEGRIRELIDADKRRQMGNMLYKEDFNEINYIQGYTGCIKNLCDMLGIDFYEDL